MFDYLPLDNANFFIKISNLFFFTPPYCIVLYRIYTFNNYIALFAANTNQKRFQCERPRGKRAVLRELKEALYSPVNNVDRVERMSWFQSEGPMIAKACVRAIEVLARGTKRS